MQLFPREYLNMKITIVSPAYPLRGGIAHFTGLLYKELAPERKVRVVTFKRQYPKILFPGKSQLEPEKSAEPIPSEILLDSTNPLNWKKVGKKIAEDKPDLVIFAYWLSFFAPAFASISKIVKQNNKTKIAILCHNVIPHEPKPFDEKLTKMFFKYGDYFITLSESVKKDLLKIIPDAKVKQLFHPVYSNFGAPVNKEGARAKLGIKAKKVLLFFGFIRDYKGLDTLFEALSRIDDPELVAVVAGEFYSGKEKYFEMIEKFNLKEKVLMFNDFIPTEEVKYFFSAADVVMLPYKDATQSGILQIANNFHKPVIATDVGGLSELIDEGKTGFVVEKNNPPKIAEAINKFYENYDEDFYAKNVAQRAGMYSWERFAKELINFVTANNESEPADTNRS